MPLKCKISVFCICNFNFQLEFKTFQININFSKNRVVIIQPLQKIQTMLNETSEASLLSHSFTKNISFWTHGGRLALTSVNNDDCQQSLDPGVEITPSLFTFFSILYYKWKFMIVGSGLISIRPVVLALTQKTLLHPYSRFDKL